MPPQSFRHTTDAVALFVYGATLICAVDQLDVLAERQAISKRCRLYFHELIVADPEVEESLFFWVSRPRSIVLRRGSLGGIANILVRHPETASANVAIG